MVNDSFLNAVELPYPLPPWRHRFRTLSVFCEVDDNELAKRIPKPLRLSSNIVQFTVMHFESTVPNRPYYDSAVITQVEHKGKLGGNWLYGFTSTDQVLCGTREIWGYNMKLADIELHLDQERIWGCTTRLGRRIVDIKMHVTGKSFAIPELFPRLFVKALPAADGAVAMQRQVVMMVAETEVSQMVWGEATISCEESSHDPIQCLSIKRIIGANFTSGSQILNWGKVLK